MALRGKAAERLKNLKVSGIRRFFAAADEIPNVINLSVGEPDFVPPKHILEGGWQAIAKGKTHYTSTNGILELREALAQKAYKDYGLEYDPDSEVLITVGGTEAIALALLALVNPGDEVLIPNPGFVCYSPSALIAGGVPISVPLLEENGFKPSMDTVTSLITEKSRVMILNSPNNPTGAVFSRDELAAFAKIAVEHDLIVISDEVYEKILYDGVKHYCVASFPGMRDRTLVVNSFSKTYAMTGLRVGYVYGPRELLSPIWLVHQYLVACVDTFAQYAALAALKGPQDFVKDMVKEFDRRRCFVFRRLNEIEGFTCTLPKGAFYIFPNIKSFKMSSEDFAQLLLKEARVATVPGSTFGSYGEGYIRISYAASYEQLEEALNRIERAVRQLKS
ncbi:MAG: pyridoxal phosphate-dependent aminotransferase [Candidatus Bathyarchaeota archaeon]|nr:pyridoxal phosphate-dependent aminotransferase [Candidatus Bathyarchaeota archaeon]MDW8039968.1 pyridoxal phosphate-dependent aminotransferase [Nitrososphaerota archaeon]